MASTTTLLDLITANLLQPGIKLMVRDVEGELTPQGTIISINERGGTVEYKTPTAFSKAVTNNTSGGWLRVKLKSSGGSVSLFDVKRKFAGYSRRKGDKPSRSRDAPQNTYATEYPSKPANTHIADEEEEEDEDVPMSGSDSEHNSASPPSPIHSPSSTPPRSTRITKHSKHTYLPPAPSDSPHSPSTIFPSSSPESPPPTTSSNSSFNNNSNNNNNNNNNSNGKTPPHSIIVKSHHTKRPYHHHIHTTHTKEVELLVHVESTDSIPYEVTCAVDGYDALRARIAATIPDFPFHQPHEMGIYSEYWEKKYGVAFVKPPREWVDFPACTTVLLKKIPERIIVPNNAY